MIVEEPGKISDDAALPAQRLCNEIQLFDLCDLDSCTFKEGRFCTNAELLTAFERISDAEAGRLEEPISEELEDDEELYDDENFEADEYEDESGYDEE
jgi:hypothetical protein